MGHKGLLCRVIQHLEILSDVFYLDGSSLKAYSLTDNLTVEVARSQVATTKEATLYAVHLVHSLKQAILLVFFKRAGRNGENRKLFQLGIAAPCTVQTIFRCRQPR